MNKSGSSLTIHVCASFFHAVLTVHAASSRSPVSESLDLPRQEARKKPDLALRVTPPDPEPPQLPATGEVTAAAVIGRTHSLSPPTQRSPETLEAKIRHGF